MTKIKLDLSQINWKGAFAVASAGFMAAFTTESGRALAAGASQADCFKQGAIAGTIGAGVGLYGFFTQRTKGVDGDSPVLPSLSTSNIAAVTGDATSNAVGQVMLTPEVVQSLNKSALVQIGTAINNILEAERAAAQAAADAEAARVRREAELEAELAQLRGETVETEN